MGYVIASVAARTGRGLRAEAEESYAVTLWTFLQLKDQRRIASALAKLDRLDLASLVAFAFHEPSKLDRIHKEEIRAIENGKSGGEEIATRERELIKRLRARHPRRKS